MRGELLKGFWKVVLVSVWAILAVLEWAILLLTLLLQVPALVPELDLLVLPVLAGLQVLATTAAEVERALERPSISVIWVVSQNPTT